MKNFKKSLLYSLGNRNSATSKKELMTALENFGGLIQANDIIDATSLKLNQISRKDGRKISIKWVEAFLEFARVAFESRRISYEQFVFYSFWPLEMYHESLWTHGEYSEDLKEISKKIESIERREGATWLVGEGPKEWNLLNQQYDRVIEGKLTSLIKETGSSELNDLRENEREKFEKLYERGRRTLLNSGEKMYSLKDVIENYISEAEVSAHNGAYSSGVFLYGAATEGIMALRCLESPIKAARIASKMPNNAPSNVKDPLSWTMFQLTEICIKAKWFKDIEYESVVFNNKALINYLRSKRNLIHPGRVTKVNGWKIMHEVDFIDAKSIYTIIQHALSNSKTKKN